MSATEQKIIKIVDTDNPNIEASVESVGAKNAVVVNDAAIQSTFETGLLPDKPAIRTVQLDGSGNMIDYSTIAQEATLQQTNGMIDSVMNTNVHTGNAELRVFSQGHVCDQNSTSTPLGINATFTGEWQDTLDYSEVIVTVYTDKNSVTDGLQIQWSTDGISIHNTDTFTISATSGKTFTFQCVARYVRVVYTNDGVAQTYFTLQTQLKRFASKGSSHRLKDVLSQEDDAIVTKSLISGFTTAGGGNLIDVKVTPSGALATESVITSSALPTGASTSALQTSGNTLLSGIAGFTLAGYDYIALTYVTVGNGIGEIQTVTFKSGGSSGTTVATLTLAYDVNGNLTSVTKS